MNKIEEAWEEFDRGNVLPKDAWKASELSYKAGAEWALNEAVKELQYGFDCIDCFTGRNAILYEFGRAIEEIKGLLR